ncbi:hypothetical protein BDV18DRAFT_142228 [Aspergillus unguis]
MKFTTAAVAASMALTASALPSASTSAPSSTPSAGAPETFGVVSIHSGEAVQYAPFSAARGSILAGLPKQNATCEGTDSGSATFYIQDGALYLYTPAGTTQEFSVDRSGMGQGNIGYYESEESMPRNGERTGWAIDENNHLQFDGSDLIACPGSIDGAYSIWANAGVANPAYNQNCTSIAARVEKDANPVQCVYSS